LSNRPPVIGVTCDVRIPAAGEPAYELFCDHRYVEAVKRAGGFPLLLPIADSTAAIRRSLEAVDGLILVGGADLDPALYGERPREGTGAMFAPRLRFERSLYRAAVAKRLPVFGICYGMQLINVLEGGTLHQDIQRDAGSTRDHRDRRRPLHAVSFERGSRLRRILGVASARTHSDHHQAVRDLAPGFRVAAVAPDRVVEAIESDSERILAVQWHPERTLDSPITRRLFRHFVGLCRG
jgi:putative glutamine amidotransferase